MPGIRIIEWTARAHTKSEWVDIITEFQSALEHVDQTHITFKINEPNQLDPEDRITINWKERRGFQYLRDGAGHWSCQTFASRAYEDLILAVLGGAGVRFRITYK